MTSEGKYTIRCSWHVQVPNEPSNHLDMQSSRMENKCYQFVLRAALNTEMVISCMSLVDVLVANVNVSDSAFGLCYFSTELESQLWFGIGNR